MSRDEGFHVRCEIPGQTGAVSMVRAGMNVAVVLALAVASGCAKEERGPLLVGGRELKSWLKDLHDPKPQARRQAVLKLGNVAEADPAVAEGLVAALLDQDPVVRREAVLAVVKLRDPTPAIIERLEAMSRDDRDPNVRDAAKRAASHIAGGK
ncbi:MAG: HEAT repeat domain-containing protein [Isosphaeraceae bacterium]